MIDIIIVVVNMLKHVQKILKYINSFAFQKIKMLAHNMA